MVLVLVKSWSIQVSTAVWGTTTLSFRGWPPWRAVQSCARARSAAGSDACGSLRLMQMCMRPRRVGLARTLVLLKAARPCLARPG